jgi:chromosome segregation ATPase
MSQTPITLSISLEEALSQINQKLSDLKEDVMDIKIRLTKVETQLNGEIDSIKNDIKEIKGSQKAPIGTLIGILVTAVRGFLVAVGRFVLFTYP